MKKLTILIFIIMYIVESYSFHGWQWVHPFPSGEEIKDIKFINIMTGFAVGRNGAFIKTTNGGDNWQLVILEDNNIRSLWFINENTGFVCGERGLVLKTTNAGYKWAYISVPANVLLNGVCFVNESTGYTVGMNNNKFKTTDGGNSWFTFQLPDYSNLTGVTFINSRMGFIRGSRGLYRTTDYGLNWAVVYNSPSIESVYFIDSLNGHLSAGFGVLSRTTDGGANWQSTMNGTGDYTYGIHFGDIDTGYACGVFGYIYKTTDKGVSWTPININVINKLLSIHFLNSQTGYTAGEVGIVLKTTNGGINWTSKTGFHNTLLWMDFASPLVGYICGGSGTVLKSTNEGETWSKLQSPVNFVLHKIRAVTENVCYISGKDSFLIKTIDGGLNWTLLKTGSSVYTGFDFRNEFTGLAYGGSDYILKTTNGGFNWFRQYNGLSNSHISPIFILNDTVAFGASNSKFYKTTNLGVSWIQSEINGTQVSYVCFPSQQTGYISCYNGQVYKTTNTGDEWILCNTGATWLQKLSFPNVLTGYALGSDGYIIKTTNGGINWTEFQRPISPELHDIDFLTPDYGFICGLGGAILKTGTGGIIINKKNNFKKIPYTYHLHQNYPNPFNPKTKIRFEIPKMDSHFRENDNVRLTIYNSLGQIIETQNIASQPGTYEYEWDGTNYPSGVYFYKLTTSDFTETKRMVLIK